MTTLTQIPNGSSGNETTANEALRAVAPAGLCGIKSYTGLTLNLYGGYISVSGVLTSVADWTGTMTASSTNYVEVAQDGTVTSNTSAFTAGRTRLFTMTTDGSGITSFVDYRILLATGWSRLSLSIAGAAATTTLTAAQAANKTMEFTGAITGNQNVVVPNSTDPIAFYNGTSGAFTVTFKTASGTGIVVATGKRAMLYADGTNVVRVSADQ